MSVMYGNAEYEDFKDHPEGKFEGIVYCWKYQGEKTNAYGDVKKRAMLRVESMDEFMEDGRPFSVESSTTSLGESFPRETHRGQ